MRYNNKRWVLKMMLVIGAFFLSVGGIFAYNHYDNRVRAEELISNDCKLMTDYKEKLDCYATVHLNDDGTAKYGNSKGVVVEYDGLDTSKSVNSEFTLGSWKGEPLVWRLVWDYGDNTGVATLATQLQDTVPYVRYAVATMSNTDDVWSKTGKYPFYLVGEGADGIAYDHAYFAGELYEYMYGKKEKDGASMNYTSPDYGGTSGGFVRGFLDSLSTFTFDKDLKGVAGERILNMNDSDLLHPFILQVARLYEQETGIFDDVDPSSVGHFNTQNNERLPSSKQVGIRDFNLQYQGVGGRLSNLKESSLKNEIHLAGNSLRGGFTYSSNANMWWNADPRTSHGIRPFIFFEIPKGALTNIILNPSVSQAIFTEGSEWISPNGKVGEIEPNSGIGPFDVNLSNDSKIPEGATDQNNDVIPDNAIILTEDDNPFVLSSNHIDSVHDTVSLEVKDSKPALSPGDYYIKVTMKDNVTGQDGDELYPTSELRQTEQIFKISVKPVQETTSDLNFTQSDDLKSGQQTTAPTALAGTFSLTTSGYKLLNSIVSTNGDDDASYFEIDITSMQLKFKKQIVVPKTYFLTIYVTDGTSISYKQIQVTIDPGYPQITSLGYNSPYTFTYGDASIIPTPTSDIGTANITLSEADAGNSPYTFDLIDDVTYLDNQYFEVDSQGTIKYKGTTKLGANTSGYTIKVEVTDSHGQKKSEEVNIIVNKAIQKNYKITNTGEIFVSNKLIPITTSGKESDCTGAESFQILEGNGTIASLSGTNQYQMLSIGTFKLEATVAEDTNYKEKKVTQEITLSDLPVQKPLTITGSNTITYGDNNNTYLLNATGGSSGSPIEWSIDSDTGLNGDTTGTGATINGNLVTFDHVGKFTVKAVMKGNANFQDVTATKEITVNKMNVTATPNPVSKYVGQAFNQVKLKGVRYSPSPLSGDDIGTPAISSKYPDSQPAGIYNDGLEVTGLSNDNYMFQYETGTLTILEVILPEPSDQEKSPYYEVTGTKGKNDWYTSDIQIKTTGKDGYTKISQTNGNFTGDTIIISTEGETDISLYFQNTDGTITKPITYHAKIDKTAPSIPTMTVDEINNTRIAKLINLLSFGSWMNQEAQVTMSSNDSISGIDIYEYIETIKGKDSQPKSSSGTVNYGDGTELNLKARACDKAGNCSAYTNTEELKIDKKGPSILGVKDQSVYKQYYIPRFITIEDTVSGPDQASYTKDGGTPIDMDLIKPTKISGKGTYYIQATDQAQNETELTFKIVPFPPIEDIDGTDESKDIIDQIQKELDEARDQLESDEIKDHEKWIEDATKKWESMRKKVVETDDKSAKVEGQGETSFDPKVELIVDPITEKDVPVLPRKAISIYDVYLIKGDQEIQPNGEIKVYLPYTDNEVPIIYEIDDDGKIKEITGTAENGYATFNTTVLRKYAISNAKQDEIKDPDDNSGDNDNQNPTPNPDDNKDPDQKPNPDDNNDNNGDDNQTPTPNPDDGNNSNDGNNNNGNGDNNNNNGNTTKPDNDKVCALGPDGKPNTSDDVCGTPNEDGEKPIENPDGSITIPDGGSVIFPDGSEVELPDGGTIKPDGSVELPDGTIYDKDGNKKDTDKKQCDIKGKYLNIDSDGDGRPDVNLDINGDCYPDINIDTDNDGYPNVNIDTTGDGKPNINIDTDNDGKADINIVLKLPAWKPELNTTVDGFAYDTMRGIEPDLNIDTSGDGKPNINVDTDGDGNPDQNVEDGWYTKRGLEKPSSNTNVKGNYTKGDMNTDGVSTGDNTKWYIWLFLMFCTLSTMGYNAYKKHKRVSKF